MAFGLELQDWVRSLWSSDYCIISQVSSEVEIWIGKVTNREKILHQVIISISVLHLLNWRERRLWMLDSAYPHFLTPWDGITPPDTLITLVHSWYKCVNCSFIYGSRSGGGCHKELVLRRTFHFNHHYWHWYSLSSLRNWPQFGRVFTPLLDMVCKVWVIIRSETYHCINREKLRNKPLHVLSSSWELFDPVLLLCSWVGSGSCIGRPHGLESSRCLWWWWADAIAHSISGTGEDHTNPPTA